MAGIHRRRPGADAIAPAKGDPAVEVGDGIWLSAGLSNSYMLTTDEGRVVLNSGMGFEGPFHRQVYDAVDTSAIRALVFTQGHYDHVGGADHLTAGEDAPLPTELVAQENFEVWRADNERLEAFRSRNAAFAWIDAIVAAMEHARSCGVGDMAQARPEPTRTFGDRMELDVGGRHMELIAAPGGETFDSLVVWLPGERTLFTGNLTGPLFGHVPNLVTIRGDRYRDALAHIESLELVLDLEPDRLLTGHFDPIEGAELIAEEVTAMRDAMAFVHDRTIEGMNAGLDVHTLMREVTVPEHLDVGEGYGRTAWNVRAIWENYAGWFHHRSTTELYGVPAGEVAGDVVEAAGAESLVAAARRRLAGGEPVAALHLTDVVLAAEPGNAAARELAADATRTLLDSSDNFWESAWLRRSIDKLTGER